MVCISIDASWLFSYFHYDGMHEFWRTGRVTGLELSSWDRIR